MQRVNFLAKEYRLEPVRNEEMIGICDPEGERPAYSTSDKNSPDKWVAAIKNTGNENIQFIPVDKNIVYYRDDGQKESSCDGMILYNDDSSICFVELKDVRTSGWISDAIDQLKETIKVFNKNHDYHNFSDRTAYAANCCHPNFQTSCRERLQEFRSQTHFRLAPQATIEIKSFGNSII